MGKNHLFLIQRQLFMSYSIRTFLLLLGTVLSCPILAQSILSRQSLAIYDSATTSFIRTDSAWYYYSAGRSGSIILPAPAQSPDFNNLNDELLRSDSTYYQNIYNTYPHAKSKNSYDIANKLTSTEVQLYLDAINTWQKSSLTSYTYTGGNKTEELYQVWFVTTGWFDVSRKSFTYDGRNNLLTAFEEHKSGSSWAPFQKRDYTYDTTNRITSCITQDADTLGVLLNSRYELYYYNTDTNLTNKVDMLWTDSSGVGVWRFYDRFCYEYNIAHQAIADTFYLADNAGGWIKQYFENNSFDGAGNKTVTVRKSWSPSIFTFVNDRRYTWTYNTDDQCTAAYSETWVQATNIWFYKTSESAGHIDYLHRYYYGPLPAGVTAASIDRSIALSAYPSPASDLVTIKATLAAASQCTVSLYDMQGRLLQYYTEPHTKTIFKTISVSNLPTGIYQIRVATDREQKQTSLFVTH